MEYGAQNGVLGDAYGTDLPQVTLEEKDLKAEKGMAKFSKSREFKVLKQHIEERIGFYQQALPNGSAVAASEKSLTELGQQWMVADAIIKEFRAIIGAYEAAEDAVKNA